MTSNVRITCAICAEVPRGFNQKNCLGWMRSPAEAETDRGVQILRNMQGNCEQ